MSLTSVKDFVSYISTTGVTRDNHFDFVMAGISTGLTTELALAGITPTSGIQALNMMAKNVSLPGVTFSTATRNDNSMPRRIAYDKSFGELDITFICGADMAEKNFFDCWKNYIFKSNKTVEYYDNYVVDSTIYISSSAGDGFETDYFITVKEMYPVTVTPLVLDRSSENQVLTFQVSFAFRDVLENWI